MPAMVTQVHPLVQIRRQRKLSVIGDVLVRTGQKVSASDIIAEATVSVQHQLFDVFRAMGMKTIADAEKIIQRKEGDQLDKHDIIAETGGMFSRVIRATLPGKIVAINRGQVLVEIGSKQIKVQSGFSGIVTETIKDQGAILQTNGMLIQGVWGNEKCASGPLIVDPGTIETELNSTILSLNSRGGVIVCGTCANRESLELAASLPVAGLILGSMSSSLISLAMEQPYPIILLEGFGNVPINAVMKNLLLTNSRREISLLAEKWDRSHGIRPELIISLPADGENYREAAEFSSGQIVRVHTAPWAGQIGRIVEVKPVHVSLENGIKTAAAEVSFKNNEKSIIPISNLDIIDLENRFLGITE